MESMFELEEYQKLIAKSCLFKGIPQEKYTKVLKCLKAVVEKYPAKTIKAGFVG